jgi:hypothetical protein
MARSLAHIDSELAKAVERRIVGRERIAVISSCITEDTRLIDRLLAERSAAAGVTAPPPPAAAAPRMPREDSSSRDGVNR